MVIQIITYEWMCWGLTSSIESCHLTVLDIHGGIYWRTFILENLFLKPELKVEGILTHVSIGGGPTNKEEEHEQTHHSSRQQRRYDVSAWQGLSIFQRCCQPQINKVWQILPTWSSLIISCSQPFLGMIPVLLHIKHFVCKLYRMWCKQCQADSWWRLCSFWMNLITPDELRAHHMCTCLILEIGGT